MIRHISAERKFRHTAKSMVGFVAAVAIAIGMFAGTANAQWNGYHRDYRHNWNGGYYRAPPVIYGSHYGYSYYGAPNYYPPPVIYAPWVRIPGVVVRIN